MVIALLVGASSFLVACSFEWISLKKIRGGKQAVGLAVIALQGYALYLACWQTERFWLPAFASWMGWVLLLISVLLLVYSLFIEVPFTNTYVNVGAGNHLVKTGTYALVRHPVALWYFLFLVSLLLATRSETLIAAVPVWGLMNVLYVMIQERFFFNQMFQEYEQYKKEAPMLIPTKRSIVRCVKTLKPKEATNDYSYRVAKTR